MPTAYTARIALVGDRSPQVRSHARVPRLLDALRDREQLDLDVYWIPTDKVEELDGFDGIWLLPGSPYASESGAITAVQWARENGVPFLGTCAGFHHALLEYARNICGATAVQHAETSPDADDLLIVPLACSLVGHEAAVQFVPGTAAAAIIGAERSIERYHCSYGLDTSRLDLLRNHGLLFSAFDDTGDPRIAELPTHPFYLATLFQPELAGDKTPHPIISSFAQAAATHASTRVSKPSHSQHPG
ncbi:CTP synthase C-terminal region-related (seleno)protein [Kribbella sp. CA-294648]|uniref:CTP synthase C-terminal region-related (seleno)protein n=1 Tax=Kribbella sp. CA-294648 TaxID=3239948 RepID=UPI003D8E32FE